MESKVPVSRAKTGTQSQNKPRPVGFRKLPWHIVENILLQKALSYPDVVSFIKAYAPNHHYKKVIASVGRFRLLWEKKFKQSYPDLYRLLLGSGIAGHETFTWYHLLKKRWDTGQSVATSLKAFRDKNMEETIALLHQQADNLVDWLAEFEAGDYLTPIQTDVETGTWSTQWDRDVQEYHMQPTAFVGNGRLADNDFDSQLQFLFCNRALANMILGAQADRYDNNIPNPAPNYEVPLLTKLMVVDACRDHANDYGFPSLDDGRRYDMINTMKTCQTAIGHHQIYLHTEKLNENPFSNLLKKEVPEDFFALINFFQACYPQCTDVFINFYKNAFDMRNITFNTTKGSMAKINGMLRKLDAPLLADELAFACGFNSNFPYIPIKPDNLPPIVTFFFLAEKFLSNEFVTVTLQKLTFGITTKNAENVYTDWNDIYLLLPCVRVDGIEHYCIPNKGSKDVEIFTDNVKLATALHTRLFKETNEQFGTVREVRIISVTQGSLMDHLRSYMKYLAKTEGSSRTRTLQSIYTRSKPYGGSVIEEFCQLFTNSDPKDLMPFRLHHTWLKYSLDLLANERSYNPFPNVYGRNPALPVGTVVRIKYRNFTPGNGVDNPEHFAVVVSWNIQFYMFFSETGQCPGTIFYYCVPLGPSDANDPFHPNTCARTAEKMTVVDELPEAVRAEMCKNPVLWRLFDGFDGMFFTPQPALRKKFPNDCTSQKELRKSRAMCAAPRL